MNLGDRLKKARENRGFTQIYVAKTLGLSNTALSNYERGERDPDTNTIIQLAKFYDVSTDWLLGLVEKFVLSNTSFIPILGQIRDGIPLLTEENYEGKLEIPPDIKADFALRVEGDSMIGAGILEGDYAICRQAVEAKPGDIVVALRDTASGFSETTLKYFYSDNGKGSVLRAASLEYEDIPLNGEYRIAGIMVALIRKEPPAYWVYRNYISTRDGALEEWNEVIEKGIQYGIGPEQVKETMDMLWKMAKKKSP